jgi:hypothetical protein
MSIKTILEKIRNTKKIAETEPDRDPMTTYNTRVGNQRAAKDQLPRLFVELKNEVKNNHRLIIGLGKDANKIAELAKDNLTVVNLNDLYAKIVDKLKPNAYVNQQSNAHIFSLINQAADAVFNELDIFGFQTITYLPKFGGPIKDRDAMIDLVKRAIHEHLGSDIDGIYIMNQAAKLIIDNNVSDIIVPIYVPIEDPFLMKESFDLMSCFTFFIGIDNPIPEMNERIHYQMSKVTKEEVKKVLLQIRKSLQGDKE